MTDTLHDENSITTLLQELLNLEKQKQPTAFQGFAEAANKFKDAVSSLENFFNSFLTDAKRRAVDNIRLDNLHKFTGISVETLFDVGHLSKTLGGSEDEAGNLAKHLLEMKENNPKDLEKLGNDGFEIRKFFNNGQLNENVFSVLQEKLSALASSNRPKANEILEILGLNENGLGAVLTSTNSHYNIATQKLEHNEKDKENKNSFSKAAPSDQNTHSSQDILFKDALVRASFDKAHLDEISMLAPKLEKIADALIAIQQSHPELAAEGLMRFQTAMMLFYTAGGLFAGKGMISKAGVLAKTAEPIVKTAKTLSKSSLKSGRGLLKTGFEATAGAATKYGPKALKTGAALGGLDVAAFEGLGAAGIAELGASALLAPEVMIPLALIAGGAAFFEWYQQHQQQTATEQDASLSPEVSDFAAQADQGQEIKLENSQHKSHYFQTLHQKEKQGLGTRPLSLSFGNINVTTQEDDNPFAFAEAVKEVVADELLKVIASTSPFR